MSSKKPQKRPWKQHQAAAARTANAMRAKIHIAKKECGMEDGDYRTFLARHADGKTSAKHLNIAELSAVLDAFKHEQGWKPKAFKPANSKQGRLVYALWGEAYRAGYVGSKRPTQFVRRQTGVDNVNFCTPEQLNDVIEGVKAIIARGEEGLSTKIEAGA